MADSIFTKIIKGEIPCHKAYEKIYHFVWDDLADWYIEASKLELNQQVLARVLEAVLIVLHPFAPFVTETIWQTLAWEHGSILAVRSWPKVESKIDQKNVQNFEAIQELVSEIRYLTNELGLKNPSLHSQPNELIHGNAELIRKLARLGDITETPVKSGIRLVNSLDPVWISVEEGALEAYRQRLKGRRDEAIKLAAQLEKRLKNKAYVSNAPKTIVEETKKQLAEAREQLGKLAETESRLS